eukprot:TRINITY_DN8194_c0_g1_i12.p1 TRINITY_DN8194_c0_g1~~TRINITY_DN8194_c0_g1_i12.p1  ORF type:complete len:355 (-),score=60.55 TRINITY_DN8194_c0_g1_i12:215-1279(-)
MSQKFQEPPRPPSLSGGGSKTGLSTLGGQIVPKTTTTGIPNVVPLTLRTEAYRVQNQLKILINNYKILSGRLEKNPENKILMRQLADVQNYIVFYNQEQCFLLDKIRKFLRDLENGKFFGKQLSLNSTGESSRASSTNGKPSPNSFSEDECSDRSSNSGDEEGGENGRRGGSASPTDSQGEDPYLQYFTDESLYKGHVESYSIECESPLEYETKYTSSTKKFRERDQIFNESRDQVTYMKNLEMLSQSVAADFEQALNNQRKIDRHREFLYIPEVSDRKYRNQSFLVKLALSPPQLRKRKPDIGAKHNRPMRAVTYPPARMGTRKQTSMKQMRKNEEKLEIEKLLKSEPVDETE